MWKILRRVHVVRTLTGEWYVVTTQGGVSLAGPYVNRDSARYVARLLNEILDKEPLGLAV